jgi:hypothetical protein
LPVQGYNTPQEAMIDKKGSIVELAGETKNPEAKSVPLTICRPQISD